MLGSMADLEGFEYVTDVEVREELKAKFTDQAAFTSRSRLQADLVMPDTFNGDLVRVSDTSLYGVDAIVRRASALQKTHDALDVVYMSSADAEPKGISDGEKIRLSQNGSDAEATLVIDELIPKGCVVVPMGTQSSAKLGSAFGPIEISKGDQ